MVGAQAEAAVGIDLEDRPRGLLLEPLTRVALVDARAGRELGRARRSVIDQGPIQPESIAQVHPGEVERAEGSGKQALAERIGRGSHWSSPLRVMGDKYCVPTPPPATVIRSVGPCVIRTVSRATSADVGGAPGTR